MRITFALAALAVLAPLSGCNFSPQAKESRSLKRASSFAAKKDYARALLELKNAARDMPKDAEPYYRMGVVYSQLGDMGTAVSYLRRATEINPKHAAAQLQLAEILTSTRNQGLIQEASRRLELVLANAPNNNEANDTLAIAEMKLGKQEDAGARLEQSLEKAPSDLRASMALADLKLRNSDRKAAEAVLQKAVASAPKSVAAELALGRFYWATSRPDAAEQEVHRALAIDPANADALLGLAAIQTAGHRSEEAGETYKRLSALPGKQYKHFHADFLFRNGQREAGLSEFQKLAAQDPDDRDARTRLLAAYVAMGKIADADSLLGAALRRNPKDSDALFQRAELSLRKGNASAAEADLTQVLHFHADSAQAHFALAEVYRAQGNTQTQREQLNDALRLNPAMIAARVALAWNFISSNQAASAVAIMDQTPPPQRNLLAAVVARNWALYAAGNLKEMRAVVNSVFNGNSRPVDIVFEDAVLKMAEHDHAGARVAAEEVLRHNPDALGAARILADSYLADKQPDKAIERVKELADGHPKSAAFRAMLARYYLAAKRPADARSAFEAAKTIDSGFTQADTALAQMDLGENHPDSAKQHLENVLNADKKNITAQLMMAGIDAQSGNRDGAIARYKTILAIDGKNIFALNNLAWNLAPADPDEALKYAREAAEIAPDNANIEDTLGWIYYRKGMYPTATDYLKNAVSKEPNPKREFHLAMCYLKSGDQKLGQTMLAAALQKDPSLAKSDAW